jgi:hypothetical protein
VYFLFFKDDFGVFMENFGGGMYSYGGNFGFQSLVYAVFGRYLNVPYLRGLFCLWILLIGIVTGVFTIWPWLVNEGIKKLFINIAKFRFIPLGKSIKALFMFKWSREHIIMCVSLWISCFFLIYTDIWEHHYVLFIPVFVLILIIYNRIKVKSSIILLISYLLISLPSLFIVQFLFTEGAPVEIDSLNPLFVVLYHLQKPLGVILLYGWIVKSIIRK